MANKENQSNKQIESRSPTQKREARMNGFKHLLESQPNARVVVANNPETQALVEILRDFDIHLSAARRQAVMDYDRLNDINKACSEFVAGAAEITGHIAQTFDRELITGVMKRWMDKQVVETPQNENTEVAA